MERENKLKYKLIEKKLDEMATKDEYAKRVDQKLKSKKYTCMNNQVNNNLKIMDCLQSNELNEFHQSKNDKRVRYSKELAFDEDNKVDNIVDEDELFNDETDPYCDYRMNQNQTKKNDFIHMAVHYKNLCRVSLSRFLFA